MVWLIFTAIAVLSSLLLLACRNSNANKAELPVSMTHKQQRYLRRFCSGAGKIHVQSKHPVKKMHEIQMDSLKFEQHNFVECWARSTRLGFPKGITYVMKLSPESLTEEAEILSRMQNVPHIIRCRWDCTIATRGIQVAIRREIDNRRRGRRRTIYGRFNFNALPLFEAQGVKVAHFLHDQSSKIPPQHMDGRKGLLETEETRALYQSLIDAAKDIWRSGWVHREMTVGNIFRSVSGEFTFISINKALEKPYRAKLLRKRESAARRKRGCHGNCSVGYTPMNLRQAKVADLKVEADIHCLTTSGSRAQLMERLAKHYASVSHVNRKSGQRTSAGRL